MNRLDRDILKTIFQSTSEQSTYSLEKKLKRSNYATVWRHIQEMQKNGLIEIKKDTRRKNGKLDKRRTEKPTLTSKGLATLLIDGDLQKEELAEIGKTALREDFGKVSPKMFNAIEPFFTDIFYNTFLELKSKVNLGFFDEKWFHDIYLFLTLENMREAVKKHHVELEKAGIWATEEEIQKDADRMLDDLMKDVKPSKEKGFKKYRLIDFVTEGMKPNKEQ